MCEFGTSVPRGIAMIKREDGENASPVAAKTSEKQALDGISRRLTSASTVAGRYAENGAHLCTVWNGRDYALPTAQPACRVKGGIRIALPQLGKERNILQVFGLRREMAMRRGPCGEPCVGRRDSWIVGRLTSGPAILAAAAVEPPAKTRAFRAWGRCFQKNLADFCR